MRLTIWSHVGVNDCFITRKAGQLVLLPLSNERSGGEHSKRQPAESKHALCSVTEQAKRSTLISCWEFAQCAVPGA